LAQAIHSRFEGRKYISCKKSAGRLC